MKYTDHPFDDCVKAAVELIVRHNAIIHQKFTCDKCDARQTMEEPNKFFETGICEECGTETNIRAKGCNYMVLFPGVAPKTQPASNPDKDTPG